MKCASCGGNLSLEDVVCPYCDALNEHAVEHVRQMNQYKREFEGTKKEVYTTTKGYAGIAVRAVICAALVICITLLILAVFFSSELKDYMMERDIQKNAEEYCLVMDSYLEERDYMGFVSFCNEKGIYGYEDGYEKYNGILSATYQYRSIYTGIMRLEKDAKYGNVEDSIKYIAESLNGLYDLRNPESYMYIGADQECLQILTELQEQVHALLMAYGGLSAEDIEILPELSSSKRAVLLEERMYGAE
ncbi:MAG: hypothetical protein IJ327_01940 [Lachnospiraceae bacterium]|nr:hypothetical protein [Lachnospiraceae bacterium]